MGHLQVLQSEHTLQLSLKNVKVKVKKKKNLRGESTLLRADAWIVVNAFRDCHRDIRVLLKPRGRPSCQGLFLTPMVSLPVSSNRTDSRSFSLYFLLLTLPPGQTA